MVSICYASHFASLAHTLGVGNTTLCGCDACRSLPERCVFVVGKVTVFRPAVSGCPECVVTRKDSQDRLPVAGTGAAPWGAAPENGNGNTRRARVSGLEVGK